MNNADKIIVLFVFLNLYWFFLVSIFRKSVKACNLLLRFVCFSFVYLCRNLHIANNRSAVVFSPFTSGRKGKETMAMHMPGIPSHCKVLEDATCFGSEKEPLSFKPKWYFTKEEIEEHSPSRKDGIDREYESHLRQLYCSYLQELGMELKV